MILCTKKCRHNINIGNYNSLKNAYTPACVIFVLQMYNIAKSVERGIELLGFVVIVNTEIYMQYS